MGKDTTRSRNSCIGRYVLQNTVERRAVKTAGTDGDRLEVVAGLKGGDQVVISPPPELTEGMLIREKQ